MEKLAEKVIRLTRELDEAKQQVAACLHQFSDPIPAMREFFEPTLLRYEGPGSDPQPVYKLTKRIERGYSRECETCGYSEYTAKTKPIVRGHEPDFGGHNKMLEDKIQTAYFKHGVEAARDELAEQVLQWTAGTGASGGVIGLSGGVDSTTVAYLCKYAFDRYNQLFPGREPLKLLGLIMPSGANDPKDAEDGIRIAELLGIKYKIIPIEPEAKAFIENAPDPELFENKLDMGNLYSELRANWLSRYGGRYNLRIMGTGNRDEDYILGYFTKRGDGAVDNNILGNLPKRLVRELAASFKKPSVPQDIIQRVPSAGLWAGQTDEGELGYTYEQAEIIQNGYDGGRTAEQIAKITGYDLKIVKDVGFRHKTTEHKRQPPPVGEVELGYK